MKHKVSGFSLIEMAIVLVIVGLVGGIALPSLKIMIDRQNASTTTERQEKILYALAGYALQHGALPNAASADHLSGIEDKENQLCRGIVPYATLGLQESFAKDGYHHWFTYVVEKEYTKSPLGSAQDQHERSFCRFVLPTDKLANEQLMNPLSALKITLDRGQTVAIAVAVISHGPEGRGAYPQLLNPPPQGEDEEKNTNSTTMLIDRFVSQNPKNPFSHKIVWATPQNLMSVYGHAPCPPPKLPPTVHREGPQPGRGISGAPQTEAELLQQQQFLAEQEGGRVIQQAPETTEPPLILRGNPEISTQGRRVGREEY